MGIYFGTDGIRGIYREELTPSLAFKCGNSLSRFCYNKKVVIGRDSRTSGDILSLSVTNGLIDNGVTVIDVGIASTPSIAFLTRFLDCDYGVVISASHNPPMYNGIKIFDKDGYKINEQLENEIERKLMIPLSQDYDKIGKYLYRPSYLKYYTEDIVKNIQSIDGLKIVVDLANGACCKLAHNVFNRISKDVVFVNDKPSGLKINDRCGALYPQNLSSLVKKYNADIGFAFDGDADRIIACDENGKIVDGDEILYILSKFEENISSIVGTTLSNKGFELALEEKGIKLIRADVGDKYVIELMRKNGSPLGGEPSGHIIIKSHSTTGDGLLVAVRLAQICKMSGKKLSKLIDYTPFPQVNINVSVVDKFRILNSEKLTSEILNIQKQFKNNGRVLVRASGTENKIRVMCEHINKDEALAKAKDLENLILQLNR